MQLVGRQQHAGRAADLGEPDLPRAAPADGAHVPQAADHHDAEVAAARQGRGLAADRLHQGRVQDRDRRAERRGQRRARSSASIACSGKVYYDLVARARERKNADVAIIRVEQLYPFPHKAFAAELKKYPNADRGRLVPGRAAEPGRLVLRPALHPREHDRGPAPRLRRPRRRRRRRRSATRTCTRSSRRRCSSRPSASSRASCLTQVSAACDAQEQQRERDGIDRSQGSAAVGIGRRSDAAAVEEEARRGGRDRRDPGRDRDRQGRARGAGAGRRRARADRSRTTATAASAKK